MIDKAILRYVPAGKLAGINACYMDDTGYHIELKDGWSANGSKNIVCENIRNLQTEIGSIQNDAAFSDNPLLHARHARGFRQTDLAKISGVALTTIRKYEKNTEYLNVASGKNLYKLSKALKDKQIIVRIYLKKRLCYEKNVH